MIIEDKVYGDVEINEKVLIKLIESKPLQRLKGIAQFGPFELYPYPGGFTRYDHSIGVLCLLKRLNASLEEQVAGLLHDVSHTAFSHVFDWVIGNEDKEDYQDENFKLFVLGSGIPSILADGNIPLENVVYPENYPLLEREAPDLCADRVDYALRELVDTWTHDTNDFLINHLVVYDDQIVFSSEGAAEAFGRGYMGCQKYHWGGEEWTTRYDMISEIIKFGLEDGVMILEDFYQDDKHVLNKLHGSNHPYIKNKMKLLSGNLDMGMTTYFRRHKKFRWVDPLFTPNGDLYRLSEVDSEYLQLITEMKEENEEGVKISVFSD